jgi:3-methylcrotonyl-CoA carboxylase alpha subunit
MPFSTNTIRRGSIQKELTMFKRLLIANRGEIACRIIKTAKAMGLTTIAVFSEADKNALFVEQADLAFHIGPANAQNSYLNIDKIIAVAKAAGAQAIHPGYGFLSENADFANACEHADIVFVGPGVDALKTMGSKQQSKISLGDANIPMVPGYQDKAQDDATLIKAAKKIGFPLLIKASAGGGGKGMRTVTKAADLNDAIAAAKREAQKAFGDDTLILEKYIENPRHVEVQIAADNHGACVHLFDRDCSIQRRHQKIIEEAPAPGLSDKTRAAMADAAIAIGKTIDYRGVGTIEFLVDKDEAFYFMEMNTRLQVEHPVTEMVTGVDLVEWQLKIAAGEPCPLPQQDIHCTGSAIEARLYAEDPAQNFLPATGTITHWRLPILSANDRIDSGIRQGDEVSIHYDPMIAKVITHAASREAACQNLYRLLNQTQLVGVKSNINFLKTICSHDAFIAAHLTTHFIDNENIPLTSEALLEDTDYALACLYQLSQQSTVPFQLNQPPRQTFLFGSREQPSEYTVGYLSAAQGGGYAFYQQDKFLFSMDIHDLGDHDFNVTLGEANFDITAVRVEQALHFFTPDKSFVITPYDPQTAYQHTEESAGHLSAPMPGTVVAVFKKPGEAVNAGDHLMIIEAMKMEHTICAPMNGTIKTCHYKVGDQVAEGVELLAMDANTDDQLHQ